MALISCPECKHEVSTYAATCPNCGFPVGTSTLDEQGLLIPKTSLQPHAAMPAQLPVGSYTTLGNWGGIDLDWLVLANDGEKALVFASYGLDCIPFNEKECPTTWKTCSMRTWLNADFFHGAFTPEERLRVMVTEVQTPPSPAYGTDGGVPTHDRMFLLSYEEAKQLFDSNEARACKPSANAKAKGVWMDANGFCRWWLRTPGNESNHAAYVLSDGGLYGYGSFVDCELYAVRPAMWITL